MINNERGEEENKKKENTDLLKINYFILYIAH